MAPDSLFSRSNQESGGTDDAEGVRIIDPDEAAEAVERGDAVPRKADDQPKFGDRPPPPEGPRPSLRFPLADAADPTAIDRPRVAPVEPRTADDEPRPTVTPEEPPIITVEPATGETELPHWTEPATGEVPKVIIGETDDDEAEQERWSSFANAGPRWRDEHADWDDDVASDLAAGLAESEESIGALDTTERLTQEEFLTFDDLNVPVAPTRAAPPAPAPDEPVAEPAPEPIRIQSTPTPAAAAPTDRAATRRSSASSRREPPTAAAGGQPRRSARPPRREAEPPSDGGRDVPQAIFVGVAFAVVAIILMKLGAGFTMILVEAVIVVAGIEFLNAARRGGYRPATLLGLAAIAAYPLAVYWRGEAAMPLVLFLALVFTLLWYMLGVGGDVSAISNSGVTLLGVAYVGLLGSFAALLLDIPIQGVSIFLVTIVAGVFYDVGGFFVGRQFGRTPLSTVSPNKTVEGLVGGMAVAVVAVLFTAVLLGFGPFSFGQALVFGVALAVAAPLGDLAESLMKRDLGIKDMGSLLPSHGGLLDRFDSMLFVLPTAYYMVRVLF
jgi:phosphatidate cytidylyltransferase